MSVVVGQLEPVSTPKAPGVQKRLALRGQRRTQVQKALKSIMTIYRQEDRAARAAERKNQTAFSVVGKKGAAADEAFNTVVQRLEKVLTMKI